MSHLPQIFLLRITENMARARKVSSVKRKRQQCVHSQLQENLKLYYRILPYLCSYVAFVSRVSLSGNIKGMMELYSEQMVSSRISYQQSEICPSSDKAKHGTHSSETDIKQRAHAQTNIARQQLKRKSNTKDEDEPTPKKRAMHIYGVGEQRYDRRMESTDGETVNAQTVSLPVRHERLTDHPITISRSGDYSADISSHLKELLEQVENESKVVPYIVMLENNPTEMNANNVVLHIKRYSQNSSTNLSEVIFYYLASNKQPNDTQIKVIKQIWEYNVGITDWHELCCWILENQDVFNELFDKLSKNPDILLDLIATNPDLILNHWTAGLLQSMLKVGIPPRTIHRLLMKTRSSDPEKPTCMFLRPEWYDSCYEILYSENPMNLCALLSIENSSGQTALHVNTEWVIWLLQATYRPHYQQEYIQLLYIVSKYQTQNSINSTNNSKVALEWLKEQVKKNRYVLYNKPMVLIIYNTRNRPGAKEEAQKIYQAFEERGLSKALIFNDLLEEPMLEEIRNATQDTDIYGHTRSALIVVIMSHGSTGAIFDAERNPVILTSIEEAMCENRHMRGKPKILITQCCQDRDPLSKSLNNEDNVDDPPPTPELDQLVNRASYCPKNSHFCAIMSSVAGQRSMRSLFIPLLADQIKELKEEVDINKLISNTRLGIQKSGAKQTPIVMTTLRAELCLSNVRLT